LPSSYFPAGGHLDGLPVFLQSNTFYSGRRETGGGVTKIEYIAYRSFTFTFAFFIFCFLQLVDRYKYYLIGILTLSAGLYPALWFSRFSSVEFIDIISCFMIPITLNTALEDTRSCIFSCPTHYLRFIYCCKTTGAAIRVCVKIK